GCVREVVAVRPVLDLLPSGADAEIQTASAHHVDVGGHLREHRGIAVRLRGDHGSDADSIGAHRERREERPGLEAVLSRRVGVEEQVIRDPEPAEAGGLGVGRDREHIRELEAELRLDLNAKIHAKTLAARGDHRSGRGPSSSAVMRNIMCRPVTVNVASMKPAKTAIPAFGIGPIPTTSALNAATSANHTTNAKSV